MDVHDTAVEDEAYRLMFISITWGLRSQSRSWQSRGVGQVVLARSWHQLSHVKAGFGGGSGSNGL